MDVAGEGRDSTVFAPRYDDYVGRLRSYPKSDHMETAGRIKQELEDKPDAVAFVDTIGEGAGVHSRCKEQGVKTISAKFSAGVKGRKDYSGQRTFVNARSYCYWAVRDALNPEYETALALPPDDELAEELHETRWRIRSNGDIQLEEKEEIKKRLGRSPDKADAMALSFYPEIPIQIFV